MTSRKIPRPEHPRPDPVRLWRALARQSASRTQP